MKFRGKITDIGCIQHFTREYDGIVTADNLRLQKIRFK